MINENKNNRPLFYTIILYVAFCVVFFWNGFVYIAKSPIASLLTIPLGQVIFGIRSFDAIVYSVLLVGLFGASRGVFNFTYKYSLVMFFHSLYFLVMCVLKPACLHPGNFYVIHDGPFAADWYPYPLEAFIYPFFIVGIPVIANGLIAYSLIKPEERSQYRLLRLSLKTIIKITAVLIAILAICVVMVMFSK